MYAEATFLSQRHQFLFMYKCIHYNIIVRCKIFLILYICMETTDFLSEENIENRPFTYKF